jgi:hypothetical protein
MAPVYVRKPVSAPRRWVPSVHRSWTEATLAALRDIPSEHVLSLLAMDYKADPTYVPVKDPRTRRWQVHTRCGDFEILTTGPHKWFDTRINKGGGGAIDLTMHLLRLPFVDAVKQLAQAQASNRLT